MVVNESLNSPQVLVPWGKCLWVTSVYNWR